MKKMFLLIALLVLSVSRAGAQSSTTPVIINCPSTITVDCFDVQSNGAASFSVNDIGDIIIGSPTAAHISISPNNITIYQSNGTSLQVPSIIGSTGAGTVPAMGQEGFGWNADDLPHPYISGVNLGAAPVTLSGVTDTSDAYASTSPIGLLVIGQQFCFNPGISNTTATPTLNVNALGAKTITKYGGMALAAGDLKAAHESCVIYNGTTMDLVSEPANAPVAAAEFENSQTSVSTNFGASLTTQTITASLPSTGNISLIVHVVVSTVGTGCPSTYNTVTPVLAWTGPGGTAETEIFTPLTILGNGSLDEGSNWLPGSSFPQSLSITAEVGTAITYITNSSLVSTCTTPPSYIVYTTVRE